MSLCVEQVTKNFGPQAVLRDVSFMLPEKGCMALAGPSGCGKSTLLRIVCGLDRPDSGAVRLSGRVLSQGRSFVMPHERGIGMVFQDLGLWPNLTVREHVELALSGMAGGTRAVNALLERFHVAHLAGKRPEHLSGGERQRLALARAVARKPCVVLLDEPFSQLDTALRREIVGEVAELASEMAILVVSHDGEEMLALAHRILVLEQGCLRVSRPPEDIYRRPESRFEASLFGPHTVVTGGRIEDGWVKTPLGRFPVPAEQDGTVQLVVRPSMVQVDGAGEIRGKAIACAFSAGSYRVEVQVGGLLVVAQCDRNMDTPSDVRLRVVGTPAILPMPNDVVGRGPTD